MKQKTLLEVKDLSYYIWLGIKKVESCIKVICNENQATEMLDKFDTYLEYYANLALQGKITKEMQRKLTKKYFIYPEINAKGKTAEEKLGIHDTLDRLIEVASFFGVMANRFYEDGNSEQTTYYLIKAGEVHGMIFRLSRERKPTRQVLKETSKEAEELWGTRYQILKTKTAKRISKKANSKKTVKYTEQIEFAKQKWLELKAWHSKANGLTAEKLIKEHGSKVLPLAADGSNAIVCTNTEALIQTLKTLKIAVLDGELDSAITEVSQLTKSGFTK